MKELFIVMCIARYGDDAYAVAAFTDHDRAWNYIQQDSGYYLQVSEIPVYEGPLPE